MAPSSRLAARLERLPADAMIELCAYACDASAADSRRAADLALATHDPLPQWAVDVLLSPDLLPRVFAALELADYAAAA
eukprot:3157710-Prymnesium_polylepis.1